MERIPNVWLHAILALVCFTLYANTLGHDFVLDDAIVISENTLTKKGLDGIKDIFSHDSFYGFFQQEGKDALVSGGRYRPLTQALFAIEYQLFGPNPFFGHLFNILWYVFCSCTIFYLLSKWLRNSFPHAVGLAFVAALLFAVHPIHTEVVANIKGRDEILALSLALWATDFAIRSVTSRWLVNGLVAAVVFFLALLAKENALGFVIVMPMIGLLLIGMKYQQVFRSSVPIITGLCLYMVLRLSVLGWSLPGEPPLELMNNPFVEVVDGSYAPMEDARKIPTIIYGLGRYLQLVVFPHPLTHDYYPRHIPIKHWTDPGVWLSIFFSIGLLLFAIVKIRSKPVASFSILYFFGTLLLVANIFFPIGTNLSERFLFMPSLGAALYVSWLHALLAKKHASISWILLICLCLLGASKTIVRNAAWKNNLTLFTTDVRTSINSAKMQNAAGGVIIEEAHTMRDSTAKVRELEKAIQHLEKALVIHPRYKNAYLLLGNAHFYLGSYQQAIDYYDMALQIDPYYQEARSNSSIAHRDFGRWYGEEKGDLEHALHHLQLAMVELGDDYETNRLLGIAHGNNGEAAASIKYFLKALSIKPEDGWTHYNLGLAYLSEGDTINAKRYITRAKSLNPEIK